jgi:hypothetical protein
MTSGRVPTMHAKTGRFAEGGLALTTGTPSAAYYASGDEKECDDSKNHPGERAAEARDIRAEKTQGDEQQRSGGYRDNRLKHRA